MFFLDVRFLQVVLLMALSRRQNNRLTIRRLTFSALMTALSVLMLYLGGFVEVLDVSMAALSGIVMQISVLETVQGWTWAQYAGGCILALALMPFNFAGWCYFFLYGYYPIVKYLIEYHIHKRPIRIAIKGAICVLSGAAMYLILRFLIQIEDGSNPLFILLGVLFAGIFVIYDLLLTRISWMYVTKLKPKLHLNLK